MKTHTLPANSPKGEYFVAFDVGPDKDNYVRGVKITIELDAIDQDESVRIDLCDHPLYTWLQSYVTSNK